MTQREILVTSSLDGSVQPSLFYKAEGVQKRPLLVGLHTWSYNRFNQIENMLPYAEKYNFSLLLPEFRGPNLDTNPDCTKACASEYALCDVADAIDYAVQHENADKENIFLLGLSGGGHMALMLAGYCPEVFKAVAAYVPITDLSKWKDQNAAYRRHVLACAGGSEAELCRRSPITYIDSIAKANIKVFHGKYDPVVPVSQSIEFYIRLTQAHPDARAYLDIFDGGHEIDMHEAMYFILSQYEKKGKKRVTG